MMDSGLVGSEVVNGKVLRGSAIFTCVFTIVALTVGFLTSSQVILFDGVFNLVGLALTYLSIVSLRFISKRDELNYPFGKATFEPFIAIVQYCIILYICITNIATAIQVIISGGHAISIASGILYGVFSVAFNVSVYVYLRHLTKHQTSAIAEVEIDQWKFSCLLGIGILVGFGVSFGFGSIGLTGFTPYVDPILTVIITLLFGRTAFLAMKGCVRELLLAAPGDDVRDVITDKIAGIDYEYDFLDKVLRLGKVGNKLIVELDYVIECDSKLDSILVQDELRNRLMASFGELRYESWLNVAFSGKSVSEHA